ncbi:MAG TPA: sugar phosphate isomerase/epimerase family protein [Pyrinomonadaceae bacterium]|nr:sugar phosphate isomerase/epimerase family protein [Pyrinomonadaceae bacterium]
MPTFKLSVINDEISQDFGRAAEVAAQEFGLQYIEIRGMWGKNIMKLDAKEIAEARKILEKHKLRVSSIASPIFKVDWPGAPLSRFSPKRDQFGADFTFEQQDELLERGFELTRVFQVDRIRIFDFWRLEDPKPYRAAMDQKLIEATNKANKHGVTLLIENEPACNTGTGAEAARTLAAVRSRNFKLNWDPGNAASLGEIAYPDGYSHLPKDRIGYMHCKDVVRGADGKYTWMKMGAGIIDYVPQYQALRKDGYRGFVSLETHWRGAGTPEESTRQSMAGMKELLRRARTL